MRTLGHIINPVIVGKGSDLYIAQPITLHTMKTAKEFAIDKVHVALFSAQYKEDRKIVPDGFYLTPDLDRSILDIRSFQKARKLPLIGDILDRLYEATDAEYFMYTNIDVALQPYFYIAVNTLIDKGYDAFTINRRTISREYTSIDEVPMMYAEIGEPHKGWDCFVFKREIYPEYEFGTACIGAGWIGRIMLSNLACFGKNFTIFKDLQLTFHIGNEKSWKADEYKDYLLYNRNECQKILLRFEKKFGEFDRNKIPGRFLELLQG